MPSKKIDAVVLTVTKVNELIYNMGHVWLCNNCSATCSQLQNPHTK